MKNVFLLISALLIGLEAMAWEMPKTSAECLRQPMHWMQDPGYGNPLDEDRVEAACSASSRTEPDTQFKEGSICVTTIARVQNGYNELVRKKQETCALVDRFMPKSGCKDGSSQQDQRKCFMAAIQSDENAREQVGELIRSFHAHRKIVQESIPPLAQAAKHLAEIGKNLTEETAAVGQSFGGDYSAQAKRNAAKIGAARPWEGAEKINPGLRMSGVEFEKYKQFIDTLVGSDVSGDHLKQIESISSPHLRQQAMALYEAKRFTKGAQVEAQEQQGISQTLAQNSAEMKGSTTDLSSMGSGNGFNMNQAVQGTALANQAAAMGQRGSGGNSGGRGEVSTSPTGMSPALKDLAAANSSASKRTKEGRTQIIKDLMMNEKEGGQSVTTAALDSGEAGEQNTLKADLEDRKSLRDKLKERNLRSGASRMPASAGGGGNAPAIDANGKPILDKNGNPLTQAELDTMIESGDAEALASFSGPDLGGGLALAGSETDEMVESLVDEMKDALGLDLGEGASFQRGPGMSSLTPSEGKKIQSAREILAADSQGLFERIRVLHQRCQQKGCVLGKQESPL